jgi:glycosyltransferase involved in cell wall biosynthesis
MKILWIARTCPYPANDGEKIRVFNLIKNLSHHDITLVFRAMHDNELQGIPVLREYCREVRYAYIPSPSTHLTRVRWCLPFVFTRYPISLATVYFKEIADILRELCDKETFDVVHVEHSSLTIYLDALKFKNTPHTILTLHNVDWVRNSRVIANTPPGIYKLFLYYNQLRFQKWETESIMRYDTVIAVSDTDRETIRQMGITNEIDVVPNGVDTEKLKLVPQRTAANSILFVASMDSEANHDGAMFFLEQIYPIIKASVPGATLFLVGRNPRQELKSFDQRDGISVTGEVPDVRHYYEQASVAVVPLRSGGGTRLKILEAMALGIPVVSTTVGCEGLQVQNGKHLVVVDDPKLFAAAVIEQFDNDVASQSLVQASRKVVEEQYDWRTIAAQQDRLYSRGTCRG